MKPPHVLLTRYNGAVPFRIESNPLDEAWLDYRGNLFRRFCLPSIERQTCKGFRWFIFFHPDTPRRHYAYLEGIATVIVETTEAQNIAAVRQALPASGMILSTRIDSDDGVAPDFVQRMQECALNQSDHLAARRDFITNYSHGVTLSLRHRMVRARHRNESQFGSLVEFVDSAKPWKSVLSFNHAKGPDLYPNVTIDTEQPMWIRVLHERNFVGPGAWEQHTTPPMSPRTVADIFPGCDEDDLSPPSFLSRTLLAISRGFLPSRTPQ